MTALRTGSVLAHGITFHYLEAGTGPLVLCLHGFPDNASTYRHLLPVLAAAGFRAVAPYMRGYAPTSLAPDGRYQAVLLAQDAVALVTALGAERALLIGHDWGAQATYGAAILAPQRIARIVTFAAAHPGAARGALAVNYERLKGIWHAYFFQMPFAEQTVAANDFAFLESWWRDASPNYTLPAAHLERIKQTFRQPGVVNAALNYYRHTFHPAQRDPALHDLHERLSTSPVSVPTLAFHGTHDRPGRLEAFETMDDLFTQGVTKILLPGTGHFLHLERPEAVAQHVLPFLQQAL
ncbi:MAG: alpha/beta fold hydrolase [Candidatus Tectimicrobiota bacterium]